MDALVAALLQYGAPGIGLIAIGFAYLQEKAERKEAQAKLTEYLDKDRYDMRDAIKEATSALAGATRAQESTVAALANMSARLDQLVMGARA